jgi:hypothetical protein
VIAEEHTVHLTGPFGRRRRKLNNSDYDNLFSYNTQTLNADAAVHCRLMLSRLGRS